MADITPSKLVLRCYGYQAEKGKWIGVCLDFNLAIQAESPEALKRKMADVIISYVETVLNTEDKTSIPELLFRRAPIRDWLIYYRILLSIFIRQLPRKFTFKEVIPFHFAHNC